MAHSMQDPKWMLRLTCKWSWNCGHIPSIFVCFNPHTCVFQQNKYTVAVYIYIYMYIINVWYIDIWYVYIYICMYRGYIPYVSQQVSPYDCTDASLALSPEDQGQFVDVSVCLNRGLAQKRMIFLVKTTINHHTFVYSIIFPILSRTHICAYCTFAEESCESSNWDVRMAGLKHTKLEDTLRESRIPQDLIIQPSWMCDPSCFNK